MRVSYLNSSKTKMYVIEGIADRYTNKKGETKTEIMKQHMFTFIFIVLILFLLCCGDRILTQYSKTLNKHVQIFGISFIIFIVPLRKYIKITLYLGVRALLYFFFILTQTHSWDLRCL